MQPAVIEGLAGPGYAVTQGLFDETMLRGLRSVVARARAEGRLAEASVGRGPARHRDASVRGDLTLWIDPDAAGPAESAWLSAMETLRLDLNRELCLGAFSLEAHFAVYAPGARYARHSDRHSGSAARVVSTVLYLNDDWDEADGGELRIFVGEGVAERRLDVTPRFGTFVAFLSDRFEHEVLASRRERWSLTGWMRRRA